MVTKSDCLLLLFELKDSGLDITDKLNELLKLEYPTIDIITYINKNRQLDVQKFYEKLRDSYNHKRSNLYINIVREEIKDPKDSLITLASLNLQILLFAKKLEDPQMFLRHARFDEINQCLLNYARTYDLNPCLKLLELVRADLKVLKESEKENNNDKEISEKTSDN